MSQATPMPTPNIPDEVVEAAAKALADAIGHGMTEKCEAHARLVIEAALPLLLEPIRFWSGPNNEPLYRLKVSNEQ